MKIDQPTSVDTNDLGYYATPAALNAAHPTAVAGNFAIVGSTDTVWVWDTATNAWLNTYTTPTAYTAGQGLDLAAYAFSLAVDDANVLTNYQFHQGVIQSGIATGITSSDNIGFVAETYVAGGSNIGAWFASKTNGANPGIGSYGIATVNNTADTASAIGGQYTSSATHAGGNNIGILSSAINGLVNYSFYGLAGYLYNLDKIMTYAASSGAVLTNFINAKGIFSNGGVSGISNTDSIGAVGDCYNAGSPNVGLEGATKTNGVNYGIGILGVSGINNTADTADSIGGEFIANTTHVGGRNIGVYSDALNGATNYSFYGLNGNIYNNGDIHLESSVNRIIDVLRNSTANTAGVNLDTGAGGATIGATDKDGGNYTIYPGISTGTGLGAVKLKRNDRAASTGTADNAQYTGYIVAPVKQLANNTTTDLFSITPGTDEGGGGAFRATINIVDTTNHTVQTYTAQLKYEFHNQNGAVGATITEEANVVKFNPGALTNTVTWSVAPTGTTLTFSVKSNSTAAAIARQNVIFNLDALSKQTITLI